jgi:hypothetical protein
MRKLITSFLFCVFIVTGCSSNATTPNIPDSNTPENDIEITVTPNSEADTSDRSPSPGELGSFTNPYNFGSYIELGTVGITLGKLESNIDSLVQQSIDSPAPPNYQWARVQLSIKNLGNDKIDGSFLLDLSFIASTGEAYESELVFADDEVYDLPTLYPGGEGTAFEYFLLPDKVVKGGKWALCVWGWPDRPCYEVIIDAGS